jgi:hypothetical protein
VHAAPQPSLPNPAEGGCRGPPIKAEALLDGEGLNPSHCRTSRLPGDLCRPVDPSYPASGDSNEEGRGRAGGAVSSSVLPWAGVPPAATHSSSTREGLRWADGSGRAASGSDCSQQPCCSCQQAITVGGLPDLDCVRMPAESHRDVPAATTCWSADAALDNTMSLVSSESEALPTSKARDYCGGGVQIGDRGGVDCFRPVACSPAVAPDAALVPGATEAAATGERADAKGAVEMDRPVTGPLMAALYEVYLRCSLQVRKCGMDGYADTRMLW